MKPSFVRRLTALIASFSGLAASALAASPTADYRFVPVNLAPVGSLILLAKPDAKRAAPAAVSGESLAFGSSLGSSANQAEKSLSMPTDLPRFDSSPIRANVPVFRAPLPPILRPISRPN